MNNDVKYVECCTCNNSLIYTEIDKYNGVCKSCLLESGYNTEDFVPMDEPITNEV